MNNMRGWISVKDQLPDRAGLLEDESEYVLVSEHLEPFKIKSVGVCGYTADGWDEYDNFGVSDITHITHWMPLPDPPVDADTEEMKGE